MFMGVFEAFQMSIECSQSAGLFIPRTTVFVGVLEAF
jgi:hypothetical protein